MNSIYWESADLSNPSMRKNKPLLPSKNSAKEMSSVGGEPRYMSVFNQLSQDIADGVYPVGELLPTEHQLCEIFGISRFTVRNALRMLTDAGLVTRRPRVGSIVTLQNRRTPYVQTLETMADLLQYTESTRFVISRWETLKLNQTVNIGSTQLTSGQTWMYGLGVRTSKAAETLPVCLTRVYLNPVFKNIIPTVRRSKNAVVYRCIEKVYGVKVAHIEQQIDACAVSASDAVLLMCPAGSPALRIQRMYFDTNNLLMEISDSLHPSGRFSYRMSLQRSDLQG
ncbi:MAG: GntR family transcriptional regulator [Burkholderiaceae bacterium]